MSHKKAKSKKAQNKGYNQNQQANSHFDELNNEKFQDNSNARA